jgi:hypothetical protein
MKLKEVQIPEMTEFTEYKRNWQERTERISCDRIPKKVPNLTKLE